MLFFNLNTIIEVLNTLKFYPHRVPTGQKKVGSSGRFINILILKNIIEEHCTKVKGKKLRKIPIIITSSSSSPGSWFVIVGWIGSSLVDNLYPSGPIQAPYLEYGVLVLVGLGLEGGGRLLEGGSRLLEGGGRLLEGGGSLL